MLKSICVCIQCVQFSHFGSNNNISYLLIYSMYYSIIWVLYDNFFCIIFVPFLNLQIFSPSSTLYHFIYHLIMFKNVIHAYKIMIHFLCIHLFIDISFICFFIYSLAFSSKIIFLFFSLFLFLSIHSYFSLFLCLSLILVKTSFGMSKREIFLTHSSSMR